MQNQPVQPTQPTQPTQQLYKFPSIEQFRSVVKLVSDRTKYVGKDENNNAVYDNTKILPIVKFHGTVKLHGTNHSIVVTKDDFYTQSRERISTPQNDNAGSSIWSHSHKDYFIDKLKPLLSDTTHTVVVYGEWCGQGIQKGVAISNVPKMFVIFGIKLISDVEENWLSRDDFIKVANDLVNEEKRIFHIEQFKTFDIEVDFEDPHLVQNILVQLTEQVENVCPVGKYFDVEGIGEGIVWSAYIENIGTLIFKTKGDKHSNSKCNTTKVPVDIERINNIKTLVETLTPNWRLEQAYTTVFDTLNGGIGDIKRMGELIKWVMNDIVKEELDTISNNGFVVKDISSEVSKLVRNWFLQRLDS